MADNNKINTEEVVNATTSDIGPNESLTQINDNKPAKPKSSNSAIKCLSALLCVLLVCGIFLTIMNSLLAVTDQERFDRAINKIYGKPVTTESIAVADYNTNATIVEAYRIKDDGNYLIKSTGKGGYDGGTVTCWVVIEVGSSGVSGVGKVVIDSNTKQSYIDRVGDKALNQFSEIYVQDIYYTQDLITNATVAGTKTAICNSVNGALDFVNAKLGNVASDPYENFLYKDNIQTKLTSHVYNAETETVVFTVVSSGFKHASNCTSVITVDKNGVITAFEVTVNGSTGSSYADKSNANAQMFVGKNAEEILAILNGDGTSIPAYPGENKFPGLIQTGASETTYSLYNAALFAATNYQKALPEPPAGEETPDEGETPEGGEQTPDDNEQGGNE